MFRVLVLLVFSLSITTYGRFGFKTQQLIEKYGEPKKAKEYKTANGTVNEYSFRVDNKFNILTTCLDGVCISITYFKSEGGVKLDRISKDLRDEIVKINLNAGLENFTKSKKSSMAQDIFTYESKDKSKKIIIIHTLISHSLMISEANRVKKASQIIDEAKAKKESNGL